MLESEQVVCDVTATMKYVVRGEKSTFHAGEREKSYWPGEEHQVTFHDMRPEREELALERNGFVLLDEPTDVAEFTDPDEKARYAKQCENGQNPTRFAGCADSATTLPRVWAH